MLNENGYPCGGLFGFIRALGNFVRKYKINRVYVCWDGEGGSTKRRKMSEGTYKEGRKPIKANRTYDYSEAEHTDNRFFQMALLKFFLNMTPIVQIELAGVEADDIIAYLAHDIYYEEEDDIVVIQSSDKDFFQLLNDRILVFRPVQKEMLNKDDMIEKYNIRPRNFCLFRAIVGDDKSDNISGVKGVGDKAFLKLFPFFSEDRDITIDEVIDFAEKKETGKKYQLVSESKELISKNYELMQLYSPIIGISKIEDIESQLFDNDGAFQRSKFIQNLITHGIGDRSQLENFLEMMMKLSKQFKVYGEDDGK